MRVLFDLKKWRSGYKIFTAKRGGWEVTELSTLIPQDLREKGYIVKGYIKDYFPGPIFWKDPKQVMSSTTGNEVLYMEIPESSEEFAFYNVMKAVSEIQESAFKNIAKELVAHNKGKILNSEDSVSAALTGMKLMFEFLKEYYGD